MNRPAWRDAALAASLARIPLVARRVGSGVAEGRHVSRLPGSGLEFAQYRGYQPGDDPRRVDWKLLARSDRFFVREADAETTMSIRFLLDASASMGHEESGTVKHDVARTIVAALVEAIARNGDIPSLGIVGGGNHVVPPSRDRRQVDRVIDALDRTHPQGPTGDPAASLVALGGGTEGMVLAVTDWHDTDDSWQLALERSGLDATLMVLRTAREQDVAYGRAVTLQDLESGARVTVDGVAQDLRGRTLTARLAAAERAGIDVVVLDPTQPLEHHLLSWLARRAGRR